MLFPEINSFTPHNSIIIGLAKKFVRVWPYDVMDTPERTFWPTQYYPPFTDEETKAWGSLVTFQDVNPANMARESVGKGLLAAPTRPGFYLIGPPE